ncbi:MAG: hypothetical protein M3N21_04060 [Actinomycetota bacterium]|nr:hypothetical protein [Actinomycetota bacterium]
MTEARIEVGAPEPQPVDETNNQKLQLLVEDAALRGKPFGGEKCGNCLYYLDGDSDVTYCWHPQLRILVGAEWWCQWWEAPTSS